MTGYRYDAYCGIYCGACEVVNAASEKDKERVARTWGSTPDQVNCMGCKTDTIYINCSYCKIRSCAQKKEVEFCIACDDYPCGIYEEWLGGVERAPHMKVTDANLKYIKKNGIEKWLEDQKTKWRCPRCGEAFAWYTRECKKCQKDLRGIKDYENLTDQDSNI